jgi:hypothetical protein
MRLPRHNQSALEAYGKRRPDHANACPDRWKAAKPMEVGMTETWEGAQWVLATGFVVATMFQTFIAPVIRKQIGKWKGWFDFIGWWIAAIGGRLVIVAILYWGGFWT